MTNINESYQPDLVLSDDEIKFFNEDNGELVLDKSLLKGNKIGDYILIRFIGDDSDTVQKYRVAKESVESGDFTLDWIEGIENKDELDSLLEDLEDIDTDNLSPYISGGRDRGKMTPREVDNGRNNIDMSLVDDKTVAVGTAPLPYVDAVNFHRRRRDEAAREMRDNMKLADELIRENERNSHRVPRTPALKKMKLSETGRAGGVMEDLDIEDKNNKDFQTFLDDAEVLLVDDARTFDINEWESNYADELSEDLDDSSVKDGETFRDVVAPGVSATGSGSKFIKYRLDDKNIEQVVDKIRNSTINITDYWKTTQFLKKKGLRKEDLDEVLHNLSKEDYRINSVSTNGDRNEAVIFIKSSKIKGLGPFKMYIKLDYDRVEENPVIVISIHETGTRESFNTHLSMSRSRKAKNILDERIISTDVTEDEYSVTDEADPFDMLYRKLTSTGELVTGISKRSGKEAKFTERGPYEVDQVMVDVNDNIVVYATTREELDPAIKIAEKYGVTYQIDKPNMFARTYPYSIVLDPWTADLDKLVAATGYRDESYEDDIETEIVEEDLSGASAYEKILKVISKPKRADVKEDLEDISVEEVEEESDLPDFIPEDDVTDVFNRIKELDKLEAFDRLLERMFPDGMSEEELNDLLRYDAEWVFKMLDIAED